MPHVELLTVRALAHEYADVQFELLVAVLFEGDHHLVEALLGVHCVGVAFEEGLAKDYHGLQDPTRVGQGQSQQTQGGVRVCLVGYREGRGGWKLD